jgi:DNA-directed RNA polymerase specialized sigma24 family protein
MTFNPAWIILRIWRKASEETRILENLGWPNRPALNALVELYRPQIKECVRIATLRFVSARITVEDLEQAVYLHLLEKGLEWDPSRCSFSDMANMWGSKAISQHCARFRYPVHQGRQVIPQKKRLSVTTEDFDLASDDIEGDPIFRRQIQRIAETMLTPTQQAFLAVMAEGDNPTEASVRFGFTRSRGHQIRDRIADILTREGVTI